MGTISLSGVGVTASERLFSNLDLVIQAGDRLGLVASNGRGKTTLLKLLAGDGEPGEGAIVRSRGLSVALVPQDVPQNLEPLGMRDAVLDGLPEAERPFEGWRADVALDALGTPTDLRDREVRLLSGGWQRLMLLARAAVSEPDLLLLDEPTNHLDLAKILLLERWIAALGRGRALVVASHDRAFLDAVTNRTLFMRASDSHAFALPYSRAKAALDEIDASGAARLERDLKKARQLRKQAAKLTNIGINSGSDLLTVKAKYLKDRAARIEEAAVPQHRERAGEVRLQSSDSHARVLVTVEPQEVAVPGGGVLFRTGLKHIFQGDRIVLLGRNGVGKSVFVRRLRAALKGNGESIRATPSLVEGYVDQAMSQLPERRTAAEIISAFAVGDARARALLAGAGFSIERQGVRIEMLSPGQRARLGLLVLRLTAPNFYILDEPTNHIDIPGREALEAEVAAQDASAVIVSHDRAFVRAVGTRFWQISGRRLEEVDGPEPFFAEMAGDGPGVSAAAGP